jgi:hypothetical protein
LIAFKGHKKSLEVADDTNSFNDFHLIIASTAYVPVCRQMSQSTTVCLGEFVFSFGRSVDKKGKKRCPSIKMWTKVD